MQPRRPHGQRAPSSLTTMWPISPAAPRPSHGLPSSTMPPPTPVPQKTPSSERIAAPGAELELGVGRDLHVVAERDRRAERSPAARRRAGRCPPSRAGCARCVTVPASASIAPGEPTPMPSSADGSIPAASAASRSAAAIAVGDVGRPAASSASAGAPGRGRCCRRRRRPSGSSCRRGRSRRALWPSAQPNGSPRPLPAGRQSQQGEPVCGLSITWILA